MMGRPSRSRLLAKTSTRVYRERPYGLDADRRACRRDRRLIRHVGQPRQEHRQRAAGFISRHGELMQVELDALDPDELHRLYTDAIAEYWDASIYDDVVARERQQRASS